MIFEKIRELIKRDRDLDLSLGIAETETKPIKCYCGFYLKNAKLKPICINELDRETDKHLCMSLGYCSFKTETKPKQL